MSNARALRLEHVTVILVLVIVTIAFAFWASWQAYAADDHGALLVGTVKSESGDKISGVTVSPFRQNQWEVTDPGPPQQTRECCNP